MIGNMELTGRTRWMWIAGAMLIGIASQFCINYGVCAAPI